MEEKLLQIQNDQVARKNGNDFTQVKRVVTNGVDQEIRVYGNPKKKYWGYQVVFREQRKDGEYMKSVGYGEEAESRTFDWIKIEKL